MATMGKPDREAMLLRAALDGNLCLLKKMARALDASGQGEAAVLAATAASDVKTALHLAAMEGRMDVLKYLVEDLRLDVNPRPSKGYCEIVELLLSRGTSVNLVSLCGTPLHVAALHGQAGTMKILLEHHADPNMAININDTPLYNAIHSKSLECMKLLIEAGADVNFIDSNGFSYVMVAVGATPDIMNCLLGAGANPMFRITMNTCVKREVLH
ncbi:hypothetical protein GQ55_2G153900 [Panicum hallii var. hallii]|uniref:PGG domain-containing protein n=1 Tax=Panicum hallii var. hallii TaxID=1504633 RepID=A0A2T7EPU2_9POAL|nr:hypothetical protein GQ55_2G153900 [Panicum hallii var. hallii]